MTSFRAEKCCRLMNTHTVSDRLYAAGPLISWSIVHSYSFSARVADRRTVLQRETLLW